MFADYYTQLTSCIYLYACLFTYLHIAYYFVRRKRSQKSLLFIARTASAIFFISLTSCIYLKTKYLSKLKGDGLHLVVNTCSTPLVDVCRCFLDLKTVNHACVPLTFVAYFIALTAMLTSTFLHQLVSHAHAISTQWMRTLDFMLMAAASTILSF